MKKIVLSVIGHMIVRLAFLMYRIGNFFDWMSELKFDPFSDMFYPEENFEPRHVPMYGRKVFRAGSFKNFLFHLEYFRERGKLRVQFK